MGTAGPFAVLGCGFALESSDDDLLGTIDAGYADLRVHGDSSDATHYRLEPTGPAWHPYRWSVLRDEQLIKGEVLESYLPTFIVSDFARYVTTGSSTRVAISGVALARHEGAVVLTMDVVARDDRADDEPLDLPALTVVAMRRGWSMVALDVVPVDTATTRALPFHRPFAVEPGTPLAALLAPRQEPLAVASQLGPLAEATDVAAIAAVRPAGDGASRFEPAPPSAMLRAFAAQLGDEAEVRRVCFHRLADLVEQVPGFRLDVGDDLDGTMVAMEALT